MAGPSCNKMRAAVGMEAHRSTANLDVNKIIILNREQGRGEGV